MLVRRRYTAITGIVVVEGITLLEAVAHVDVFRDAFALAADVLPEQVEVTFTTAGSGDDDDAASRRRLEDAVNVGYAITAATSASSDVFDAMDDLDAAEYDTNLQTAAATSGEEDAFAGVTTASVSEPTSEAIDPETSGGGSDDDDARDVDYILLGGIAAAIFLAVAAICACCVCSPHDAPPRRKKAPTNVDHIELGDIYGNNRRNGV